MIVLDCSVVAELLVSSSVAGIDSAALWHAPALLDVEIVSVLRGLLLGGRLTSAQAGACLTDYEALGIRVWPVDDALRRRALERAANLTAYDATYVALAEALDVPLLTRDRRLAAAAPSTVTVRVLGA